MLLGIIQRYLEFLNLKNSFTITDDGIKNITNPSLKTLKLSKCVKITDSGIESITLRCQGITYLDLTLCKLIKDQGLKSIAQNLPNLKCLILKGCEITDAGIEHLSKGCRHLQSLDLTDCRQITNWGVEKLSQTCEVLEELNLEECFKLTDNGIKCISTHCVKLGILSIAGCHDLTDNTLKYLEQNRNLRTLDIRSCAKITLAGVSQLLKAVKLKALITNNNSILSDQFILRHECDNFSMHQALVLPLPFELSNL